MEKKEPEKEWKDRLYRLNLGFCDYQRDILEQFIESLLSQKDKEWRERIEKAGKRLEIYCSDDTSRSVINMHGYNDGIKEIVKELLK